MTMGSSDKDFYPLPDTWRWVPLSKVATIGTRQVLPFETPEESFNYLALENIESGTGQIINFSPTLGKEIKSNKFLFDREYVLYGKLRPYLRKVITPDFEGISATDLLPIKPNESCLDRHYLKWWLLSPIILEYVSGRQTGVKMPRLRSGDLENLPIPLPPIEEQKQIVDKIISLTAQSRATRVALERIPALLKVFRQSVLAAAFRGELTERDPNDEPASVLLERIRGERRRRWGADLRAKGKNSARAVYEEPLAPDTSKLPELPEGWVWTTLQMIADVRSGVTKGRDLSKFKTIEVPYLRVANVQAGYLDLREVKRISIKEDELDGYRLQVNDVLYTEGGDRDKLGRGTVWKGEVDPCIHQNHIFCARLYLPEVNPEWVSMTGQLEYARNYVDSVASQSINLASINSTNLKAMPVPLPPKEEQLRIMEKVTALMQRAQVAEQAFVTASNQTSNLEQQILIKAFRGSL